jgi:phage-related protein
MSIYLPIITQFNDKGIARAKREFKSLDGAAAKMKFALKKAFLPATAALGAMVGMAINLAKEGEAFKTANDRITNIAKSMGLFGDEAENVSKRLQILAEKTGKNIGMDNKSIKATQAKLLTFGALAKSADVAGGAFDRATMAAIDLAAAGFGNAEGNAVQLGKALQDPLKGITALSKSGVTFTQKEKDKIKQLVKSNKMLEAQEVILKAVETQVGGTAAATANGTDKLNESFAQMKQKLGVALLPIFEKFMPYLERFAEWAGENQGLVLGVAGAIGVLAGAIVAANIAITLSNPFGAIAAGLTILVTGLVIAYKKFEWFRDGVDTLLRGIRRMFELLANAWIDVINVIIRGYNMIPGVPDLKLLSRVDFTPDGRARSSAANARYFDQNTRYTPPFSMTQGLGPYAPSDPRSRNMASSGVVVNNYAANPQAVVDALRQVSRQQGGITGVVIR